MRIHPGISLLAALVIAALLEAGLPASVDAPFLVRLVPSGVAFIVGGALLFGALHKLQRAETPSDPDREPSAIVTAGPFQFSRNPMYVANLLLMLAWVFLTGSAWFLAATIVQFVLLNTCVIPREEAMLKRAFPEDAARWFSKTRRWL